MKEAKDDLVRYRITKARENVAVLIEGKSD